MIEDKVTLAHLWNALLQDEKHAQFLLTLENEKASLINILNIFRTSMKKLADLEKEIQLYSSWIGESPDIAYKLLRLTESDRNKILHSLSLIQYIESTSLMPDSLNYQIIIKKIQEIELKRNTYLEENELPEDIITRVQKNHRKFYDMLSKLEVPK